MRTRLGFLLPWLVLSAPAPAITLNSPQTAAALVQALFNDPQACLAGSSASNCLYTGRPEAAGLFSAGNASGFELDAGIVLSTGKVTDAVGPNLSDGKTFNYNTPGDLDLNGVTNTGNTRDAAVLEFDFVARGQILSFQYLLASEEYNEFVNSEFNDVFGFFLNDLAAPANKTNLASLGGATVSINTINKASNSAYFVNNDFKDFDGQIAPFATEFDGFTRLIQVSAPLVTGNTYHLKLAIADVRDSSFDSAVLLRGFSTIPPEIQVVDAATELLTGTARLDFGSLAAGNPQQRNLTVRNSGITDASPLLINSATLPAGFSLLTPLPLSIPVGGSALLSLQLNTDNAGSYNGVLRLNNNDPDENPFVINLQAVVTAPAPQLQLTADNQVIADHIGRADLGVGFLGSTLSKTFTATNLGDAPLTLSPQQVPTPFTLVNFPAAPIAAGASMSFQITLTSATADSYQGELIFNTNDANNPFNFLIGGRFEIAPPPPAPETAAPIPTLSEWAMYLLSSLLLGLVFLHRRFVTR